MENYLGKNKLFIFDLDGTLYEGTEHFDYYAKQLQVQVKEEYRESFQYEYEMMKNGQHVVSIGKGYDIERDSVLSIDPMTMRVVAVEDWNGQPWAQTKIVEIYPQPMKFDFETIIAIGDGWWLPFVAAKHFGVKDCYSCYLATKEYMVTPAFQLKQVEGLREWLLHLKETKELVLVTNSDKEDVRRLLLELKLGDIFEHIVSSAKKPTLTKGLFQQLLNEYKVEPYQVVSIGDNFLNEIAPALVLGMKAVYIQAGCNMSHKNLNVVSSIRRCYG